MPHLVLAVKIPPIKANVVVRAIVKWRFAPPHENDIAFFGQAAGEKFLLCLKRIPGQVAGLDEGHVIGSAGQDVIGQAGPKPVGPAGDGLDFCHNGIGVQPSFPQNIGHKPTAV